MSVVVWSLPECQGCRMTVRLFTKRGVKFEVRDLSAEPETAERFRADGHLAAPIVEADGLVWSGFRPDLIREVAPS